MMSSRIEKNLLTAMRVFSLGIFAVFGLILLPAPELYANAPACNTVDSITDGNKSTVTTCRIDQPDVNRQSANYPTVTFEAGDTLYITAGGCVQTGGIGKTWKRYVHPSGPNADRLYHGLIQLPGTSLGRIVNSLNHNITISAAGTLTLGYEDDGYPDNGYRGHDDGTEDQCKNVGTAWVEIKTTRIAKCASFDNVSVNRIFVDNQCHVVVEVESACPLAQSLYSSSNKILKLSCGMRQCTPNTDGVSIQDLDKNKALCYSGVRSLLLAFSPFTFITPLIARAEGQNFIAHKGIQFME